MKRNYLFPLFITISVAFAIGVLPFPDILTRVDNDGDIQACTYNGPRHIMLINLASAQSSQQPDCDQGSTRPAQEAEIRQTLNLKQNAEDMYFSGTGFSADVPLEVDVHLFSQGTLGSPYEIFAFTDETGSFVSQSMRVLCPDQHAQICVVATDRSGLEYARVFDPGEFRC